MSAVLEASCSQCRFFRAADALNGACHRFPPHFDGEGSAREVHHWRFPAVSVHAWCGEYQALALFQMSSSGATS